MAALSLIAGGRNKEFWAALAQAACFRRRRIGAERLQWRDAISIQRAAAILDCGDCGGSVRRLRANAERVASAE
jgi:hypothetical protein